MFNRALVTIALLMHLLFGPADAIAAPPVEPELPEVLTLDRALELLRDQSPQSQAEQAQVEVAAAGRVAARVYPNPSVSYGAIALAQGANTGAAWQHQIVIEQPLLLGHRRVRRDLADLDVSAERARVTASLAARALDVRQAFATLLARQERVRVLEESITELSRLEQIVRGRHEAGDRSEYDVARIELETTSLRVELRNAETDVEDAAGRLAALLGFPGWQPRAEGSLEPRELPTEVEQLWATAERQRPSIAAARAQASFARGGLTLARRERLPVPALALGTLLTQNDDSASLFFGFSFPLPVFDRGQGAIARATAEIQAGELAVEAELAESRAELERAQAVYVRHRETLQTIEQQMVERIPTLRRMAEESYRGGTAGILELLDSFQSVKEIRLTHLDQREAVKLAEAELIAAAGLEPLDPG
jgi:cobalt-zinc-cadmium efflux system outer membrane protein